MRDIPITYDTIIAMMTQEVDSLLNNKSINEIYIETYGNISLALTPTKKSKGKTIKPFILKNSKINVNVSVNK